MVDETFKTERGVGMNDTAKHYQNRNKARDDYVNDILDSYVETDAGKKVHCKKYLETYLVDKYNREINDWYYCWHWLMIGV